MKRILLAALSGLLVASSLPAGAAEPAAIKQAGSPQPVSWSSAPAQPDWQHIRDAQPAGLEMKLTLPKTHFFQGEEIPATLVFSNASPQSYHMWIGTYDRSGRIGDICFYAAGEHGAEVADPIGWYLRRSIGLGGGMGNYTNLGTWKVTLPVNEWLRFDHPGTYQLWAWSQRVRPDVYRQTAPEIRPAIELVSDRLTITIDPLTPQDEASVLDPARQAITAAAAKADNSALGSMFGMPDQKLAESLRQASYLRTPGAIQLLLPFIGNNSLGGVAAFGLLGVPDPKAEAPVLLDGVRHGRPLLDDNVIRIYTALKTYPSDAPLGLIIYGKDGKALSWPNDPQQEAQDEILAAARQAAAGDESIAASTAWAAFQLHPQDAATRAELANHQLALSASQRAELLQRWQGEIYEADNDPSMARQLADNNVGGSDLLPVVRQMCAAPEFNPYALQVLAHLAPAEAKPLILADLQRPASAYMNKPHVHFGGPVGIDALPDQPMPEFTAALRAKLKMPYDDQSFVLPLVDRYGTPDLLPDAKAYFTREKDNLGASDEISYRRFCIKCDPTSGLAGLKAEMAARKDPRYDSWVVEGVFADRWLAVEQPFVIAVTQEVNHEAAFSAIKVLHKCGNSDCAEPVVAALVRLNTTTAPKEQYELSDDVEHQQQAHEARDLLAKPPWPLTESQKARLKKVADSSP